MYPKASAMLSNRSPMTKKRKKMKRSKATFFYNKGAMREIETR